MPANISELLTGFGYAKQDDLVTPNTASGIWQVSKIGSQIPTPELMTEDDAAEIGKGHEYPANVYNTHWDFANQIEKFLTAEYAAFVMAFSLGHVIKTGADPDFIYTCTPLVPATDGLELPYFSYVGQIRPSVPLLDRIMIGCCIEGWTLEIQKGPGRDSAKMTVDIVGSGKYTEPSTITLPTALAEKLLSAASLSVTINGTDYVAAKTIDSLTVSWKNNLRLDDGFYPGSGFQSAGVSTSGAIRGRMEVGNRELSLSFTARLESSSTEQTKLVAGTENTAVLNLAYDADNDLTLTFQRIRYAGAPIVDVNGLTMVQVDAKPLYHSSNGLLTAVCNLQRDGVCEVEP